MHLLRICDFSGNRLAAIVERGLDLKRANSKLGSADPPHRKDTLGDPRVSLVGKVIAMMFFKPSTRTRVSFESGMAQLGGSSINLDPSNMQMSRGESIEDTAKVLSSMCDAIVIRAHDHKLLESFASFSAVPVINALTDIEHPCQVLADIMTFKEVRGDIEGKKIAWIGDCNNVCRSWIAAAPLFGFDLVVSTPERFAPDKNMLEKNDSVTYMADPATAARDAACVVTDSWYSMGDEEEKHERIEAFKGYTVDEKTMALASDDALFMHCLPAHRGEEVAPEVIDGDQSVVWDEAENRMHVQKALLVDILK